MKKIKPLTQSVLFLIPFTVLYTAAAIRYGIHPDTWSMGLRVIVAGGGFGIGAIITTLYGTQPRNMGNLRLWKRTRH
jgi:hypothetical protein